MEGMMDIEELTLEQELTRISKLPRQQKNKQSLIKAPDSKNTEKGFNSWEYFIKMQNQRKKVQENQQPTGPLQPIENNNNNNYQYNHNSIITTNGQSPSA